MHKKTAHNNLPIEKIIKLICTRIPAVQAIYLFGSAVTQLMMPESDVDLAVLASQKIDMTMTWQVAQELASLINKDVDLIDLWQASTVMRCQVVNTGQRIFVKDKTVADEFETIALSSYIRFNEERHEILEDIRKRGSVY